jgi:hypothetical protein
MTVSWKCNGDDDSHPPIKKCFMARHVPDHNVWDDCYPGDMSMTDFDQVIELGCWFTLHEWKDPIVKEISKAQIDTYDAFCEQVRKGHTGPSHNMIIFLYGHAANSIIERFEVMVDVDGLGALRGPMTNFGTPEKNFEVLRELKVQWGLKVAPRRIRNYLLSQGLTLEDIERLSTKQYDFMPKAPW